MSDTEILDYIRRQGGQWASNSDFQKAIGLNKSQLSAHLNRLESQGMLVSEKEKRGGDNGEDVPSTIGHCADRIPSTRPARPVIQGIDVADGETSKLQKPVSNRYGMLQNNILKMDGLTNAVLEISLIDRFWLFRKSAG